MAEEKALTLETGRSFRFTRRPMVIAAELRPDWKMAALLLILDLSSRGGKSVRGIQGISDLNRQVHDLIGLEWLAGNTLAQRLAFEQLHCNEGSLLEFVDIMDDADVGMIQSGSRAGFPPKPLQHSVICGVVLRKKLESQDATKPDILSLVHHTHTAAAELFQDPVVGYGLPDHDSHRHSSRQTVREILPHHADVTSAPSEIGRRLSNR